MQAQLDDLGRSLGTDVHALLVLDGAGWHVSHALRVPANMTLLKLPPYAPELNPAEMLWRELRQCYLSNRLYPDIHALDVRSRMKSTTFRRVKTAPRASVPAAPASDSTAAATGQRPGKGALM